MKKKIERNKELSNQGLSVAWIEPGGPTADHSKEVTFKKKPGRYRARHMDLWRKEFACYIEEASIKLFESKTAWKAGGPIDGVFQKNDR